jgi:hypothetical protein
LKFEEAVRISFSKYKGNVPSRTISSPKRKEHLDIARKKKREEARADKQDATNYEKKSPHHRRQLQAVSVPVPCGSQFRELFQEKAVDVLYPVPRKKKESFWSTSTNE